MNVQFDYHEISKESTKEQPRATSKDRLYIKRQGIKGFRHEQKLSLDSVTTEALIEAQGLEALTINTKKLSRTVIIRRAVLLYARCLIKAAKSGNTPFLLSELAAMLDMTHLGRKSTARL